jgi:hypothetical protein
MSQLPCVPPESVPARAEPLPWRSLDGRAVIVQPQAGEVHELNPVGAFLWGEADGRRTVAELAQAVAGEFEVEPAVALADAREFFGALTERGMIRLGP